MVVSIIGAVIGALIAAFGLYYLVKEWKDPESKKIYGIISGIGGVIFCSFSASPTPVTMGVDLSGFWSDVFCFKGRNVHKYKV